MLNNARNSVAHEEVPREMFVELEKLGRHIFGPNYNDNPESPEEIHDQFRQTLQFMYAWVTNP